MGDPGLAGEGPKVQVKSMRRAGRFKLADRASAGGALLLLCGSTLHGHGKGIPKQPKAHALQARHQVRVVICGLTNLARRRCACTRRRQLFGWAGPTDLSCHAIRAQCRCVLMTRILDYPWPGMLHSGSSLSPSDLLPYTSSLS